MSSSNRFTGAFGNWMSTKVKNPENVLRATTVTDAHMTALQKIINANKPGNTQFEKMSLPEALTAVNNQIDALNKKISRPIPSADEQGKLQKEIDKLQKEIDKIQKEATNSNSETTKASIEKIKTQIAEKQEQHDFNQPEKDSLIRDRNALSEEPNKLRTRFALKMFEHNLKQLRDAQTNLPLLLTSNSNCANGIKKIDACCKTIAAQLNGPDALYIEAAYAEATEAEATDTNTKAAKAALEESREKLSTAIEKMKRDHSIMSMSETEKAQEISITAYKRLQDLQTNANLFTLTATLAETNHAVRQIHLGLNTRLQLENTEELRARKIPVLSGSISDLTASEQANGQFGFTHYVKDEMGKYKKEVIKDSQGHMLTLSRDEMQSALTKWNDREKARCTATGEKFVAATIKGNFFGSGYTVKFPTSDLSSGSEKKADFIKTEMLAAANSRYDDIVEKMPTASTEHQPTTDASNPTQENTQQPSSIPTNEKPAVAAGKGTTPPAQETGNTHPTASN